MALVSNPGNCIFIPVVVEGITIQDQQNLLPLNIISSRIPSPPEPNFNTNSLAKSYSSSQRSSPQLQLSNFQANPALNQPVMVKTPINTIENSSFGSKLGSNRNTDCIQQNLNMRQRMEMSPIGNPNISQGHIEEEKEEESFKSSNKSDQRYVFIISIIFHK